MEWIGNLSLKFRIMSSITLLILLIVAFQVTYFPAHEKEITLTQVNSKVKSLTEIVSMGVGLGFGTGNLPVIAKIFDLAKKDPDLEYIVVLDGDKSKVADHNPNGHKLDYSRLVALTEPLNDGKVLHFALPVEYDNEQYGYVALGISLDSVNKSLASNLLTAIVIGLIGLSVGVALAYAISNMIVKPLEKVGALAEEIANGNLIAKSIDVKNNDELAVVIKNVNTMKDNLSKIISQVKSNANEVASAATEIAAAAEQSAKGASEQTSQTSEVAASVEEMSATIIQSAQNASAASASAKNAADVASEGGNVVNEAISGMSEIAASVAESAVTIGKLGKKSDEIGEIIEVIDDIADQTNLLALNAAIEAARAGEQGRGFAVVADEVRKLAERTTKATAEIASMIKGIQDETGGAVESMQNATTQVEAGTALTAKAGEALTQIVSVITDVQSMVEQIATASDEQSAAADEISSNVNNISSVAQQNSQGAEQIASASEQLNRQTDELNNLVEKFKIKETA